MTKAELITKIVSQTGIEKPTVTAIIEELMTTVKQSMIKGENIYLRGFGTFLLKQRAEKIGRNISKGTSVRIPAHIIPAFKPAREFAGVVKANVKVK